MSTYISLFFYSMNLFIYFQKVFKTGPDREERRREKRPKRQTGQHEHPQGPTPPLSKVQQGRAGARTAGRTRAIVGGLRAACARAGQRGRGGSAS